MAINMVKLPTQKQDLVLRVAKGHFATSHSHINYYLDVTMQKTRLSEAHWNWSALIPTPPSWIPSSAWTAPR